MHIGIGATLPHQTPAEWADTLSSWGCTAAVLPVDCTVPSRVLQAYLDAAKEKNLIIGEVGVWKSTLSPDEKERAEAVRYAKGQLALAEEIGARCCVNITGNAGQGLWDQYSPENGRKETYTRIVDTIREIIDAVHPQRTFYTLECMPWMEPDSPASCLRLLHDIDRPAFGVHLDYTNMVNSVARYRRLSPFIRTCFRLLGTYIRSVHAKDIRLENMLPCCIREVQPGEGAVDFSLVLREAQALDPEITVFVEHLQTPDEYRRAVAHLVRTAKTAGI